MLSSNNSRDKDCADKRDSIYGRQKIRHMRRKNHGDGEKEEGERIKRAQIVNMILLCK